MLMPPSLPSSLPPSLPPQVLDVRLYGRVSTASILRLPNEPRDVLFISTERYGLLADEDGWMEGGREEGRGGGDGGKWTEGDRSYACD